MVPQRSSYSLECVSYVMLYGKRNFIDLIKLRILRQEDYPELSNWAK